MPSGAAGGARLEADVGTTATPKIGDARLATIVGAVLFVLVAWPLGFLRIPPYQDLPGHLAAVTILAHPERYPEFMATGFLKPNSFFFLWTVTVGRSLGHVLAAKLFALGVLAGNAFVLPRFVLHFTDRRRMLLSSVFLVPMVHNWFVSMGMLSFAASVPVTLLLVMELDALRQRSSVGGNTRATLLALLSWYLHPFPVLVVGLMVVAAGARDLAARELRERPLRERVAGLRAMLPPLVPAGLLAAFVLTRHVAVAGPKMDSPVYNSPNWALYNVWSQWMYGFTELTAVSLVPAIVLAVLAAMRWREGRGLLGPVPLLALVVVYVFGPYVAFDANYIAPRLIPFLWACMLVRLPSRLPRPLVSVLGVSAAVYVVGMSVDLFRLSRELDDFAAGAEAMPEGARLLPLNFNARVTSKNTFSLGTAWGLYVLERHTSAIDAWANVPSMPIMLRAPLPPHLEPMSRLRFIKNAATPERYCGGRRANGFSTTDCEKAWRGEWDLFWHDALPAFDFILLWDPPAAVVETVPPSFRESFARGRLHILKRVRDGL